MAQSPQPGPSSAAGSSAGALQRGKACLSCRRRKMKCDGVRPVCGQCNRAGKPDDCEYTDGQGRSRTQILEERIAVLEARIQELENPDEEASSIILHDPHSPTPSSHSRTSSHSSSGAGTLHAFDPWTQSAQAEGVAGPSLHSLASPNPSEIEPTLDLVPEFLDIFFRHSSQLGWFLYAPRFRAGAQLPPNPPNPNRPIPLLLSTVWLWAATLSRLSTTHEYSDRELGLATRVRSLIGVQLSNLTPHQVLQVLQAKVLFALYLLTTGQLLEGKQMCDEATSLALDCGLHKIRSAQPLRTTGLLETASVILPEPLDQIEEGERLNAFWTVFSMDRSWAVVLRSPTIISDDDLLGAQIDTPWPLDMETYERGQIYPNLRTSGTLRIFLSGFNTSWPWENQSILALMSKASALFERAARLSASWRPGSPNVNGFYTEFLSLDQRIEDFKSQLVPLANLDFAADFDQLRSLHIVHCLAHSATIQLHGPFADQNQNSRVKSLGAAMGIVHANAESRSYDFSCMHPLMAMLWSSAARVIIDEIAALGAFNVGQPVVQPEQELELRNAVERLVTSISIYAPCCPLMNFQLTKVQQAYAGV